MSTVDFLEPKLSRLNNLVIYCVLPSLHIITWDDNLFIGILI